MMQGPDGISHTLHYVQEQKLSLYGVWRDKSRDHR